MTHSNGAEDLILFSVDDPVECVPTTVGGNSDCLGQTERLQQLDDPRRVDVGQAVEVDVKIPQNE